MKISAYIAFFICICMNAFTQTDAIYIVKTDTVFMPEKQDRIYKFFVENRGTETNHLWKLNLVDIGLVKPNVGYEHRLGKAWSVEGYLSAGYDTEITRTKDGYSLGSPTKIEFEQLFKYYYNLGRRERLGKKTYGFNGNYIASSFQIDDHEDKTLGSDSVSSPSVQAINLGIKYGIQRRIGNIGYIEIYAALYYRWESIYFSYYNTSGFPPVDNSWKEYRNYIIPEIGIRAGFAIDSFDNLRRMLKD